MKYLFTSIIFFFAFISTAFGDTLTVSQDSTSNYIKIQDAINQAANGDFILVYPGVYHENINFLGKTLLLSSLYCQNPSDSIVNQTIIDGNHAGSCITLTSYEQNCFITGFTIMNGIGTLPFAEALLRKGGGIYVWHSSATIEHCHIHDNTAAKGGGIFAAFSFTNLAGNLIYNNHAHWIGGGVNIVTEGGYASQVYFDPSDLNSIYLNYAPVGYDISMNEPVVSNLIHLDTGTVALPNYYYIMCVDWAVTPINNLSWQVDNAKLARVNGDVYVSPSGDNNNSGTSPEDPLKNIWYALLKTKSDSTHLNTIWLSEGIYSHTATNEKFGLGLKNNVAVVGAGINNTVLDLENSSWAGQSINKDSVIIIKNLTFKNGNGYKNGGFNMAAFLHEYNHYILWDNLRFENMNSKIWTSFVALCDTFIVKNTVFDSIRSIDALLPVTNYKKSDTMHFQFQNCTFTNCSPSTYRVNSMALQIDGGDYAPDGSGRMEGSLVNCLFAHNRDSSIASAPSTSALALTFHIKASIINCTFCDNRSSNTSGGALSVGNSSKAYIYNTIFYNNIANQMTILDNLPEEHNTVMIYNSCIEHGIDGVVNYGPYNLFYYDSTNISDYPEFVENEDYYYNLNDNSPCINAGTLNFPDSALLPETDLAGNPRVVGSTIDIGAYEWNPMVGFSNNQPVVHKQKHRIKIAPNPFSEQTHIIVNANVKSSIEINIYTQSGLLIKHLCKITSVKYNADILWNGTDNSDSDLPSGIYYIVMSSGDKVIESVKIIKL
ncbi:MAG: hypothetical protein DRJ09_03430 [Bacteroidetes bacterium]|nr:MAG: hypothetical protein DRJ09_03430 [Bacteroidota bacterium]